MVSTQPQPDPGEYRSPQDVPAATRPHWLVADFEGYMKAQGYNPDLTMICSNFGPDDLRDAFEAGMQAQRDLGAPAAPGTRTAEQVGTIAGTMAAYERDKVASELASLRAHAASLEEDLDDAGATIADYREALTVMQRERDAARAACTAACSALRNIALGIAGDPAVAADHALVATHEIAPRDAGAASELDAAQAAWTAYWDDPAEGEQHAWDMLPPDAKAAWGRAAEAAYPVLATQLADTQGERDHLAAALSGENEGVRLWMLDCGNLVDKHRKDAERLQAELDGARAALKAADARNGTLPKVHAHPQDEADAWLAETWENGDANAVGYHRSDMVDAYHAGWKRARELTAAAIGRQRADLEPPAATAPRTAQQEAFQRPSGCICVMFRDTGGFRIADLTCPVHGIGGSEPGDGHWEEASGEPPASTEGGAVVFCRIPGAYGMPDCVLRAGHDGDCEPGNKHRYSRDSAINDPAASTEGAGG